MELSALTHNVFSLKSIFFWALLHEKAYLKKKSIQRAPLELTCGLSMAFTTKKNQDSQEKWLIPNGEENGQDEPATSGYTRKQGSYERLLEQCQKEVRSNEGTHYTKGQY